MRIREQEDIDIVREIVAVDDNGYAEPIDFEKKDADIIVLSYQPGTGKTHNTRRFMESHPDSFYFTERHFTINEFKEEWNEQGIEYTHWRGFERRCENGRAQYLRDKYCVPAYILCRICNQSSDCDYRNQFNASERILAPVDYLLYPQFRDRADSPSYVFIDEKLSKTNTFRYDKGNILAALRVTERYNEEQRWDEDTGLSQLIENIEDDNLPEVNIGDVRGVRTLFSNAVEFALEHENMDDLETLTKLNLFELMDYIRWGSIYSFDRTSYSIPFYYYAFDALSRTEDMKLIFLDATFKPDIFQYFLEAYNGEKGFGRDITVQIFDTDLHPQKSHIFRMRPERWHPKCNFTKPKFVKDTLKWLPNQLNRIRNIFGKSNVGIITFKDLANAIKLMGYENVVHYGDLRSTNAFEEIPVIVVIGTYFPPIVKRDKKGNPKRKDIIRNIWEYFVRDTDSYAIESTQIGENWPTQPRRYLDEDTEFREDDDLQIEPIAAVVSMWDDEMYQALHRNRGINKHRIVFAYCWFPEPDDLPYFDRDVHDEFHVKKIFNEQEKDFFDWLESRMATTHIGNRALVDEILDKIEEGKTDTQIAHKFRINALYSERNNEGLIRERDIDTGPGRAPKYIRIFRKGIYEKHQPEGIDEPYPGVDITEFIEENY